MSIDIDEQYDKIYRYCFLRVRHKETAEDITQETFLRYLEHPHYNSVDKTLQLLYTIAGNLCLDEFRKKKTTELSDTEVSAENVENDVTMKPPAPVIRMLFINLVSLVLGQLRAI